MSLERCRSRCARLSFLAHAAAWAWGTQGVPAAHGAGCWCAGRACYLLMHTLTHSTDCMSGSNGRPPSVFDPQVHSAVEHAVAPGSPAAHSAPGAGNQQRFVAGVDLEIPFRCSCFSVHCYCFSLQVRIRLTWFWGQHESQACGLHPCAPPPHPACRRSAWPDPVPHRLASADGLRTPFTNHVEGYQGLLDYIW